MSALNVAVTPDAVHVFNDGALIDLKTHKLEGIAPKAVMLPDYHAVIASTGFSFIPQTVQIWLAQTQPFESLESLAEAFPEFLKSCVTKTSLKMPGAPSDWGTFDLVLAGWSEKSNEPFAWQIDRTFKMQELTRFRSPNVTIAGDWFDPANPAASGLAVMQQQRDQRFATGPNQMLAMGEYVIGGLCQHSIIDAAGIRTKVIHRWHDKIGQRIDPWK